jgi:hypothetical protein
MPFVLTVTLPHVARELGKSVSFAEISKYVEQNADWRPFDCDRQFSG